MMRMTQSVRRLCAVQTALVRSLARPTISVEKVAIL
jgi:hypothetical protein